MASIIDRSRFLDELAKNPDLISKMASMVKGEVGLGKDRIQEIIQLESAFNRAQIRNHSLDQALWSTKEQPKLGYYAKDTYNRAATPEQIQYFREHILNPVMAGSNEGERFLGRPVTGNASQMGFAGRRLDEGVYSAGKWYGKPGGSEMFVLEKADAKNLDRLGTGTDYAGIPTNTASAPGATSGVTLNSTPPAPPPTVAPAVEPTLMNKFNTAFMGPDGKGGPNTAMGGLDQMAGGLRRRVDPATAAAQATITPSAPSPTMGGGGNPAAAQALLDQLLAAKRKPYGLTLTGGLV